MKSRIVSKSVLIIGLILAVCLAVFAIKIRYSQINNLPSTPESTATSTPAATTQPSPVSNIKLKKRPTGTENWLQYVDEKNKVAFLYPSEMSVQLREVEQAKLNLMLFEPNNVTSHSVPIIIKVYEKDFERSVTEYTTLMKKNGVKTFSILKEKHLKNFLSQYEIAAFEKGEEQDYKFFDYFVSRGLETIYISLDQSNKVSNLIFETILLDGTRFED